MHSRISTILVILFTTGSLFSACQLGKESPKTIEIKGVYGSPAVLWEKGLNLNDLGVNAIFVHSASINQEMIEHARKEGLKVFAEFATLNGKGYVEDHPEAWPINERGEKAAPASWFMGVCPTEPGFREYRMDQLQELLVKFDLDGVWLDYIHWHAQFEEPEPILPETCFCDHCLNVFRNKTNLDIPEGSIPEKAAWILDNHEKAWRDWRCTVIADWASEMKTIIRTEKPGALLGIYHCPWDDKEFGGARCRILGLDYDLLKEIADVFSPMVYHGRMGRGPEWVAENIRWFCTRIDARPHQFPKVWPIVQAHNDPGIISADEFGQVLRYGLSAESTGVMMFTTWSIAEDPAKIETMKTIYNEIQTE